MEPSTSVAATGREVAATDDFRGFVEPHWLDMHRLALRLAPTGTADDVVQESLTAAWRKRSQYEPGRGTPRVWLLAIVADQARKAHRRSRTSDQLVDVHPAPASGQFDERQLDVRSALAALSERQRLAVALHYYLGLSTAEVGAVMSCSSGTVKSTLSDARRKLRAVLGEEYR